MRMSATFCALTLALSLGCQATGWEADQDAREYRERILERQARDPQPAIPPAELERELSRRSDSIRPVSWQSELPERVALPVGDDVNLQPSAAEVLAQIPDPSEAEALFQQRYREIEATARERRLVNNYRRVIDYAREYLAELRRPRQARVSLAECVQRALTNNYAIRIQSYEPAISRTRWVEAEAAFDAQFFLDASHTNSDAATASNLQSGQSDVRSLRGGFRKLLPTGMQVETSLGQSRVFTDLQFATLNPSYDTSFQATFTQPLLRGFGLDYNRAGVEIARSNHRISLEQFTQQVRDQLLEVERAYWALVSARRTVAILAESVAGNRVTYQNIWERREHDATPVEISNSRSRWQQRLVGYLEAIRTVRDAEDRLKNLLNDPELTLAQDVELIPTELPMVAPVTLDQFAEVRTALESRSEIREARERIEQARIQTSRAKNDTMPNLDLAFNYEVQGVGVSGDSSFDRMTSHRFRSYTVSLNFAVPLGQRASRAAYQRARAQESQSTTAYKQALDAVVEEVNLAVRQLALRYRQLPTQLDAVVNADRNLRALQERAETINPNFLQTELSGIEDLSNTRRNLLQIVTDYNVGIADLERAKGTLLRYNNVTVSDGRSGR